MRTLRPADIRLITRRSQVQILPPLLEKALLSGAFLLVSPAAIAKFIPQFFIPIAILGDPVLQETRTAVLLTMDGEAASPHFAAERLRKQSMATRERA
jgi:hypothetical protein